MAPIDLRFAPSCCEVRSWRSLANLNLSSCGLAQLPATVSSLSSLRILRLSHNRLTALPPELSALTALEVLAADHNLLTALPGAYGVLAWEGHVGGGVLEGRTREGTPHGEARESARGHGH